MKSARQESYSQTNANFRAYFKKVLLGVEVTVLGAVMVTAKMHGYLAFDTTSLVIFWMPFTVLVLGTLTIFSAPHQLSKTKGAPVILLVLFSLCLFVVISRSKVEIRQLQAQPLIESMQGSYNSSDLPAETSGYVSMSFRTLSADRPYFAVRVDALAYAISGLGILCILFLVF